VSIARPTLYISGPLTGPPTGPYATVHDACVFFKEAFAAGWLPFLPHINVLAEMVVGELVAGKGQEGWMAYDLDWVTRCDALVRLPGVSPGADREVAQAQKYGIPVFTPMQALATQRADGTFEARLMVTKLRNDQYGRL
jgi:hypothetical protein